MIQRKLCLKPLNLRAVLHKAAVRGESILESTRCRITVALLPVDSELLKHGLAFSLNALGVL